MSAWIQTGIQNLKQLAYKDYLREYIKDKDNFMT